MAGVRRRAARGWVDGAKSAALALRPSELLKLRRSVASAPWRVRLVVGLTVAYLLSPIDLIPDFIPVLGQLDDMILVAWLVRYVKRNT